MSHATHANAALTPRARLRLARLIIEAGWSVPRAAERYDVSWKTAKKWADRYETDGPAGMVDRSSRPHRQPNRTPAPVVRKIVHLRWKHRLGPVEIGDRLGRPSVVQPTGPGGGLRSGSPDLAAVPPFDGGFSGMHATWFGSASCQTVGPGCPSGRRSSSRPASRASRNRTPVQLRRPTRHSPGSQSETPEGKASFETKVRIVVTDGVWTGRQSALARTSLTDQGSLWC